MKKKHVLPKIRFYKASFQERKSDMKNPGRGWYRIYSFDAEEGYPKDDWKWGLCEKEQLALLIVDIGAYGSTLLAQKALDNIKETFSFFKSNGKELLVRFVYDRSGEALLKEPASVKTILEHMDQVAPIVNEFKLNIYCIQGLFIGNWGEMHGSRFSDEKSLKRLYKHWSKLISEDIFLAVRTPRQWRTVAGNRSKRLGLFNDGMFGSDTDLGTYNSCEVEQELSFQQQLCKAVPNGGEAVGNNEIANAENAIKRMEKMHVSYLNSVYDEQVLSRWKRSMYEGVNAFEYIGMHLGYRYVVTTANYVFDKKLKTYGFEIYIQNTGFANIHEKNRIWLEIVDSNDFKLKLYSQCDLRECKSLNTTRFFIGANEEIETGCKVYLHAERVKDGCVIQFANMLKDNAVLLGEIQNI